jgi:hypothetical protein
MKPKTSSWSVNAQHTSRYVVFQCQALERAIQETLTGCVGLRDIKDSKAMHIHPAYIMHVYVCVRVGARLSLCIR